MRVGLIFPLDQLPPEVLALLGGLPPDQVADLVAPGAKPEDHPVPLAGCR